MTEEEYFNSNIYVNTLSDRFSRPLYECLYAVKIMYAKI